MMEGQPPLSSDDFHELATFLESQLLESHTPGETDELRLRLTRLYMGALQDPGRAAAHAEQLLERDEVGAETLELTTGLLSQPPVPPRLAELLSSAFARLGRVDQEAATLAVELGVAPAPRNDYVRRRLAELRYREQGDPASALELIEPLVLRDPGDDEQRRLYIEIATALGSQLGAAENLVRAIKRSKVNEVRERVGLDAAMLYLQEGELKHARASLLDVVLVDGGGPAALAAARRLLDLESGTGDPQVIGTALETIARISDDLKDRQDAAERLLLLNESKPLKESRLAVAFHALVDSPRADEALSWLAGYYEKRGDKKGLSAVYRSQAVRAEDAGEGRSLALLSIELGTSSADGETSPDESGSRRRLTDQWLWLVEHFGSDPRSLGELIPRLEAENRWADLARVLAAAIEITPNDERAERLALLGALRFERLGDSLGALAAFEQCLGLDPSSALALRATEVLLAAGDHRLAAADVLEPIYARSDFSEGRLRILEARAELLPDPKSGLQAYAAAVDLALSRLHDAEKAMDLCVRALGQALAFASEQVPDWVAHFEKVAGVAKQSDMHAALLLGLLGNGPIQSFERVAIALSAIESLRTSGAADRALALCQRALESDPSSPELLHRLDTLIGERDDAKERLARYESALKKADTAGRRASLRRVVASIKRDDLDDVEGAMDVWREILAEDPADFGAYEALIEGKMSGGYVDEAVDLMDRASKVLQGPDRSRMALRKALALAKAGSGERALEQCSVLVDEPGLRASDLRAIAQIASDEDDTTLQRRALEHLSAVGETAIRRQAAEELGDLLEGKFGDHAAAVEAWVAAARLYDDSAEDRDQVRALLERVLEAQPGNVEAAERLVEVYAAGGDWVKIPEALKVLMEGGTDLGRCVGLLLRLEESAKTSRALDDFVSLIDELAGRVRERSPDEARSLARARARALGAGDRPGDASTAYRELVETFGAEEDVRNFEAFIDSRGGADERHQDRRWLYRWKSEHGPRPVDVLVEWAKAEEEYGAPDAALPVYERLSQIDEGRGLALEALCRLKLQGGDVAGGIAAFRALRETREPDDRLPLDLWAARLLLGELGRPVEAAMVLAPALAIVPVVEEARELFTQMLADPASSAEVAERVEQVASTTDHASGLRILNFLVSNGSASRTKEARLRLFERIVDLADADPEGALSAVLKGAEERPETGAFWDGAERIARRLAHPLVLADAYRRAILAQTTDDVLAEQLGRRLVRFQEERGIESSHTIEALLRVLELAPGARWALDRVKLVLGPQGRWAELFVLFDRAVDVATDEVQRGDLLYEAAFAAKDLAREPERAIGYLESLHALRAGDSTVESALERLYEKQNRRAELIGLLSARIAQASGFKRRDLRRRIATLWLDLGEVDQAGAVVEQMLEQDAFVADVVDLLERIVEHPSPPVAPPKRRGSRPVPVHDRAIALLRGHYESLDRIDDVVRVAQRSLALARDADQRSRCIRDLVGLRLKAAASASDTFVQVLPQVESDFGDDRRLARIAYKALLVRAARQLKQAPSRDAEDGAYGAIRGLGALLLSPEAAEAAFCLLYRGSRLPLERNRRRELLCESASVCADRLADATRAIRVFEELFRDDAGDEYAARSFPDLARLLAATGQQAKLASRWEEQAQLRARAGNTAEERACWERAAELWEGQASWEQAIAAHERGASLGSVVSHEALARIHAEQGSWDAAAKALEWLYAHATPDARGMRALSLSEAYVELGRRDRARASLEDALQGATGATEGTDLVRERLIDLYRRDDVHGPLARLLSSEGRRIEDSDRKLQLLCEAADLYQTKLDDLAEAATLRELAVRVRPEDSSLRSSLVDLLEALGRWDHAAAILTEQVVLFGEQRSRERAAIHLRLARALVRAGKAEQALADLRLAVEMHPAHPGILYDLAKVALELGQLDLSERTYRALLLVLHRPVEDLQVAPPPRAEVFLDLAEIAVRSGDSARAADLVDSGFDEATEHGEDLGRLEEGLRVRGRHDLLYRALERRVERGMTLTERAVALGDLAGLWTEHLGRQPELGRGIEQHAERIVRDLEHEEFTDVSAWMAVANVHAVMSPDAGGANARLVRLLETAIPKVRPGADRSLLRVVLARSFLADTARVDAAVAVLSSALAEDPAARGATELLSEVLEQHGRIEELIESLKRQLGSLPPEASPHAFADLSLRLGRALERGNHAPDAVSVYEALLDRTPVDAESLPELATRLEQVGSARLADCLEQWISTQGSVAPGLARRLVALRDKQGDVAGAVRALEAGFAAEAATADLRDRLVKHYEEQGDWAQAVRVLTRAVEACHDDRQLLRRLVDALRRAGDEQGAVQALDAAMTNHANDAELLGLRAGVREKAGDDDGAISDLEAASALDARYLNALLELLGRVASRSDSQRADSYSLRLVDTLIRLNRPKQARRELEKVLVRNPGHVDALGRVAALTAAEGNWEAASEAYRRLLPTVQRGSSREELARIAVATAEACAKGGGLEQAREGLERAVDTLSSAPELTGDLERVCRAMQDWARLGDLLLYRAGREDDPEKKRELLLRAGQFLLEDPAGLTKALSVIEQCRADNPDSVDVLLLWSRAQSASGLAHKALAVLYDAADRNRGKRSPALANIYLEIAKAHLSVDEVVEAYEALEFGFGVDWRVGDIAMLLGLVALDLDEHKTADRAFSAVTTLPPRKDAAGPGADAATKAVAFYHLASLAFAKGDVAKARRLVGKAVGGDPAHQGARSLLERLNGQAVASPASGK